MNTHTTEVHKYRPENMCTKTIWGKLHHSDEGYLRAKETETQSMYINSKTRYWQDVGSFWLDLCIQHNRTKVWASHFVGMDKLIPKFRMRGKRPGIRNSVLKNEVGELALPDSRIHYSLQLRWRSGTGDRTGKWTNRTEPRARIRILSETADIQTRTRAQAGEAVEQTEPPFMTGGSADWGSPFVCKATHTRTTWSSNHTPWNLPKSVENMPKWEPAQGCL